MLGEDKHMNIGNLLDIANSHFPNKTALIFEDHRYTYAELKERVLKLMSALAGFGVEKGVRVATLCRNCSEMIEVYLASVRLGAVFTPLNFRLNKHSAANLISHSSPMVLFFDESTRELVEQIQGKLITIPYVFSFSDNPSHFGSYTELITKNETYSREIEVESSSTCQLIYTSGTMGNPKGVMLSHENVLWNAINMIQVRNDRDDDIALIIGPLFHTAALNSHFTARLALGATCIIKNKFDPLSFIECVQNEKITVVSGTPTMFMMLFESLTGKNYDVSSVKTISTGADKCPLALKRNILKFFHTARGIYDVYGCTECSPCVTTLAAEDSLKKTDSVGLPLPFVQVRLVRPDIENYTDVSAGETGEIVVRGPNVMQGYFKQPDETMAVLKNNWLYTGDLARRDSEGYLYIVGRIKDIIVSGGENIAAKEIEDILYECPSILKAAAFGLPDPKWGEKVCLAVVAKKGHTPTAESITNYLKKHIDTYKLPKKIFFLNELPETPTGKIRKHLLKEQLGP